MYCPTMVTVRDTICVLSRFTAMAFYRQFIIPPLRALSLCLLYQTPNLKMYQ